MLFRCSCFAFGVFAFSFFALYRFHFSFCVFSCFRSFVFRCLDFSSLCLHYPVFVLSTSFFCFVVLGRFNLQGCDFRFFMFCLSFSVIFCLFVFFSGFRCLKSHSSGLHFIVFAFRFLSVVRSGLVPFSPFQIVIFVFSFSRLCVLLCRLCVVTILNFCIFRPICFIFVFFLAFGLSHLYLLHACVLFCAF